MGLSYAYHWGCRHNGGWIGSEEAHEIERMLEQHAPAPPHSPSPPRYVVETRHGACHRQREEFDELDDARRRFKYYRACALTTHPQYGWIALLHEAGHPRKRCWLDTDLLEVYAPGWTVEYGPCIGDRGYGCAETLQHLDCRQNEKWAREEFIWRLHGIQPDLMGGHIGPLSLNYEPHYVRLLLDGERVPSEAAGLFPVWRTVCDIHGRRAYYPARNEEEALRHLRTSHWATHAEFAEVDAAFNVRGSWQRVS